MTAGAVCVNRGGWEVTDWLTDGGLEGGRCVQQEPVESRAKSTSCSSSSSSRSQLLSGETHRPAPQDLQPCTPVPVLFPEVFGCCGADPPWWTGRLRPLTSTPHVRQPAETMLIPATVFAMVGLGCVLVASSSDLQPGMWVTWAQIVRNLKETKFLLNHQVDERSCSPCCKIQIKRTSFLIVKERNITIYTFRFFRN